MIYNLRVLSDDIQKDVEVMENMDLYDFVCFLSSSVSYSDPEMTSIFTSDRDWDRIQEYTAIDMGIEDEEFSMPLVMKGVKLSDIIKKKFDRLIFVSDPIMDSMYYIELMGCSQLDDSIIYPRLLD